MHDQEGMTGDGRGWLAHELWSWLMLEWTGIVVVGRYGEGGVIKCLRIITILEFPSS